MSEGGREQGGRGTLRPARDRAVRPQPTAHADLAPIWMCRYCGVRYRVPAERPLPATAAVRCPVCRKVSPPLVEAARGGAVEPGPSCAGRLAAWSVGSLVLALLVLTLGVQLARTLLFPRPQPAAELGEPAEPGMASATVVPEPADRSTLSAAWDLYEAGLHRQAADVLQQQAGHTGDPEVFKLLSRALRRAGQRDAARQAQREYRLARAGVHPAIGPGGAERRSIPRAGERRP